MGKGKRLRKLRSGNKRVRAAAKVFKAMMECALTTAHAIAKAQMAVHEVVTAIAQKRQGEFSPGSIVGTSDGEIVQPVNVSEFHFEKIALPTDSIELLRSAILEINTTPPGTLREAILAETTTPPGGREG